MTLEFQKSSIAFLACFANRAVAASILYLLYLVPRWLPPDELSYCLRPLERTSQINFLLDLTRDSALAASIHCGHGVRRDFSVEVQ